MVISSHLHDLLLEKGGVFAAGAAPNWTLRVGNLGTSSSSTSSSASFAEAPVAQASAALFPGFDGAAATLHHHGRVSIIATGTGRSRTSSSGKTALASSFFDESSAASAPRRASSAKGKGSTTSFTFMMCPTNSKCFSAARELGVHHMKNARVPPFPHPSHFAPDTGNVSDTYGKSVESNYLDMSEGDPTNYIKPLQGMLNEIIPYDIHDQNKMEQMNHDELFEQGCPMKGIHIAAKWPVRTASPPPLLYGVLFDLMILSARR